MIDLRTTIAGADRARIARVGEMSARNRASADAVMLLTDPTALEQLRDALVVDPGSLAEEIALTTPGDLEIHFFEGHELVASVTFVAPDFLRWGPWRFDARLREPQRLADWLRRGRPSGAAT